MRDIQTIRAEAFPVAIFSTYRPETAHKNEARHARLRDSLRDLGQTFNEAEGCYKGETEKSFILRRSSESDFEKFARLIAHAFDQESILFVDAAHAPGQRIARLLDCETGEEIARGPFYSTTREDALSRDAYTYVPNTGAYFVADLDFA